MELRKLDALAGAIALTFIAAKPSASPAIAASPSPSPPVAFVTASELKAQISAKQPVTIVDVRSSQAYETNPERIKGAIHVRLRRLKTRLAQHPFSSLPRDQPVVTYCACAADEAGIRAAQVFLGAGFKRVSILKGGWEAWREAGGPVERTPKP
jgi:rhodanese-related sulfurtransferase